MRQVIDLVRQCFGGSPAWRSEGREQISLPGSSSSNGSDVAPSNKLSGDGEVDAIKLSKNKKKKEILFTGTDEEKNNFNNWKLGINTCIDEMLKNEKFQSHSQTTSRSDSDSVHDADLDSSRSRSVSNASADSSKSARSRSASQSSNSSSDNETEVTVSTDASSDSFNYYQIIIAVFKDHYGLAESPEVSLDNNSYTCVDQQIKGSVSVNETASKQIVFSGFETSEQGSSSSGNLNQNLVAALLFLKKCAEPSSQIKFKTATFGQDELKELNSGKYNEYLDWYKHNSTKIQIPGLNITLEQALVL